MKRQNVRTLSLIVVTFTYLLLGAAVFDALESKFEGQEDHRLRELADQLRRKYNMSEEDFDEITQLGIHMKPYKAGTQWKFAGAFYFATTVITTIGYGHSTPKTMEGKIFCMCYAVPGIPLCLIMFQSIGERMNTIIMWILRQVKKLLSCKNRSVSQTNLMLVSFTTGSTVLTIGAAVFSRYEGWGYLDSFYYCFITLTTIGFGDFVALQRNDSLAKRPDYVAFSLIFILFGLTVVSSVMNLLVLRFLTMNTEDERRDQMEAAAHAQELRRLRGDVIWVDQSNTSTIGPHKRSLSPPPFALPLTPSTLAPRVSNPLTTHPGYNDLDTYTSSTKLSISRLWTAFTLWFTPTRTTSSCRDKSSANPESDSKFPDGETIEQEEGLSQVFQRVSGLNRKSYSSEEADGEPVSHPSNAPYVHRTCTEQLINWHDTSYLRIRGDGLKSDGIVLSSPSPKNCSNPTNTSASTLECSEPVSTEDLLYSQPEYFHCHGPLCGRGRTCRPRNPYCTSPIPTVLMHPISTNTWCDAVSCWDQNNRHSQNESRLGITSMETAQTSTTTTTTTAGSTQGGELDEFQVTDDLEDDVDHIADNHDNDHTVDYEANRLYVGPVGCVYTHEFALGYPLQPMTGMTECPLIDAPVHRDVTDQENTSLPLCGRPEMLSDDTQQDKSIGLQTNRTANTLWTSELNRLNRLSI